MQNSLDITIKKIAVINEFTSKCNFEFKIVDRKWDGFVFFDEADGVLTNSNGEEYKIQSSMLFFLSKGESYSVRLKGGYRYVSAAYILESSIENLFSLIPKNFHCGNRERAIVDNAHSLWQQRNTSSYLATKIQILSLYLDAMKIHAPQNYTTGSVEKAISFINQNFRRNFSCRELADFCEISESCLRSLFRKSIGCSIISYRESMRIDEAKIMISSGLFSLKEIALSLGYSDIYHFTKAFKSATGITPGLFSKL